MPTHKSSLSASLGQTLQPATVDTSTPKSNTCQTRANQPKQLLHPYPQTKNLTQSQLLTLQISNGHGYSFWFWFHHLTISPPRHRFNGTAPP